MIVRTHRGCILLVTIALGLASFTQSRASLITWPDGQLPNQPAPTSPPGSDSLEELIALLLGLPSQQGGGGEALPVSFGQLVQGDNHFGGPDPMPGSFPDPALGGIIQFDVETLPPLPGPGGFALIQFPQGPHSGGGISFGSPKPGSDPMGYLPGPIPLPPTVLIGIAGLLAVTLRRAVHR